MKEKEKKELENNSEGSFSTITGQPSSNIPENALRYNKAPNYLANRLNEWAAQIETTEKETSIYQNKKKFLYPSINKLAIEEKSALFCKEYWVFIRGMLGSMLILPLLPGALKEAASKKEKKLNTLYKNFTEAHQIDLEEKQWGLLNNVLVRITEQNKPAILEYIKGWYNAVFRELNRFDFKNVTQANIGTIRVEIDAEINAIDELIREKFNQRTKLNAHVEKFRPTLGNLGDLIQQIKKEFNSHVFELDIFMMAILNKTETLQTFVQKQKFWFASSKEKFLNQIQPDDKCTLLHYAAANTSIEMVEYLLVNGADPTIPDAEGYTPLHQIAGAAEQENDNAAGIIKALIAKKINLAHQTTSTGISPLHTAAFYGNYRAAEALLKNHAKVNLAEEGPPKKDVFYTKRTPLHTACFRNHPRLVKLLLDNGADPSLTDAGSNGKTPLFVALWHGHFESAHVFYDYGVCLGKIEKDNFVEECEKCNNTTALDTYNRVLNTATVPSNISPGKAEEENETKEPKKEIKEEITFSP